MPRPRTSDGVTAYLIERILEGALPPGTRLDLDALAARLGVSRASAREGLSPLERDGLVRVTHHRGVFVAPIDARTIREAFDLYGLLCALAARRAAARRTDDLLASLAEIDEALASTTDVDEFERACAQLRRVIAVAGAGPHLRALLRSFGGLVPAATRLSIVEAMAEERAALRTLFLAVGAGDASAAAAAALDHSILTADNAIRELRRRGVIDGPAEDLDERAVHLDLIRRIDDRGTTTRPRNVPLGR